MVSFVFLWIDPGVGGAQSHPLLLCVARGLSWSGLWLLEFLLV